MSPIVTKTHREWKDTVAVTDELGASLRVVDVVKNYGKTLALDHVNIDVSAGEFVTLLGASGSGKTTLLRSIAGFVNPTFGHIEIAGENISRTPIHKRGVGLVFQNYALFPHLNVYRNIAYPLARRRVPKSEQKRRVGEALDMVGLAGFESRMAEEMSGGQQQRVALARAIVFRPRLLLMDEPLGALDKRLREQLQSEIRSLSQSLGLTVINVTHDQEEALTMSDKIALLSKGRLIQYGVPESLYYSPADEMTAKFMGDANLFRGKVKANGTRCMLDTTDGKIVLPAGSYQENVEMTVIVRPFSISIEKTSENIGGGHSTMEATVTENIFIGDSRQIVAIGNNGQVMKIRTDPRGGRKWSTGEKVVLFWDPEDAVTVNSRQRA